MDLSRDSEFPPDLSPLAWVQEELRRSLEAVHKTLRRLLRDGDSRLSALSTLGGLGGEAPASQPLQAAAAQLHQVAGVLQLVGLPAGAMVLRAAEAAVERLAQNPAQVDLSSVETIERANFALLSYVARLLAGNKSSTLALFPSYRELQSFNGAERIHPADLWQFEWRWRELPLDPTTRAMPAEAVRAPFEATLLKAMRESVASAQAAHAGALSDLCASLAAGLSQPRSQTLWRLAAAVFEAQALGLLSVDAFVKRLGSRLLSQLRAVGQGDAGVSERLAQDLLFFCAQSRLPAPGQMAARLLAVRQAYGLGEDSGGDYEDETLGRIDPAWVAQARRRVAAAKESWSSAAEGETHRLAGLDEQFAAVAESLERLFPSGEVLGRTLQRAVVATLRSGKAPSASLAMEVATSMLYVEAALDDAAFDQPEQAERVKRLASRVEAVAHGEAPEPLEAWMEDLYRRVSDRQTLGSVVHELRASLSEIEREADEYFRDPSQRQLLIPVPGQFSAMRGVLTVLGLDQAALACLRMRDEVDELANTEIDPERSGPRELFERLANNLGALGFLIDMLSVQPQLAKRMFRFDANTGRLDPVMGRRSDASPVPPITQTAALDSAPMLLDLPEVVETPDLVDVPELPTLAAEPLPLAMPELPSLDLSDAAPAAVAESVVVAAAAVPAPAPALVSVPEVDPEMQEIFLEEATEVLATARGALAALQQDSTDREQLTTLRRAFHTLKGSSRMVGLEAFGEGAWACEQLYNARLGDATPTADAALLRFSNEALDYLGQWCEQIAGRQGGHFLPDPLRRSADALRLQGEVLALDWHAAESDSELAPLAHAPAVTETVEIVEAIAVAEVIETPAEAPIEEPIQAPIDVPLSVELESLDDLGLPEVSEPAAEPLDAEPFVLELSEEPLPVAEVQSEDIAFELPEFELKLDLGETSEPAEPVAAPGPVHPAAAEPEAEVATELMPIQIETTAEPAPAPAPAPVAPLLELVPPREPEPPVEESAEEAASDEDSIKVIGPLRISITLFNIFLNEADELSRRLGTSLAEWALELSRPVPASSEALAHALAGNAATVGFEDLSALARALEHALGRAQRASRYSEADAQTFVRAADDVRHLLHQFAAGFLKPNDPALVERLQAYEPEVDLLSQSGPLDLLSELTPSLPVETLEMPSADADEVEPGLPDQIDAELFPIFEEEARDLLQDLHAALREWLAKPAAQNGAAACMRALHTFKGGARLSGAMRLGEQAHDMESAIEAVLRKGVPQDADLLILQDLGDALETSFEALQARLAEPVPPTVVEAPVEEASPAVEAAEAIDAAEPATEEAAEPEAAPDLAPPVESGVQIDWARFVETPSDDAVGAEAVAGGLQALVRVRGSLLERMAAQAGEVSIRRARLESELAQMKGALLDLDDNLDRLRGQLRELELQAEAQMGAQQELAKQGTADFDPLEFDRYTRFQELTRMLAESVGDVATVQRSLQRNVQLGEDELAAQSRLTRELQDDLLRTRMVEFDSMGERMHRVVRQAARDAGRQARLEIVGGQTELDRSVLERMSGAFEHLLRNSVSHGIEAPEKRQAAGKDASGTVRVHVRQEGNEVLLDFGDDGAGLDLKRIRERGLQLGLIKADESLDDAALMQLIFAPGFSTAGQVTELSGRGVGMDVVRAEVSTLGGSIETSSTPGKGAAFTLRLPLTTALTQIVLLRCGEQTVAVPASLMDGVLRMPAEQVETAYAAGSIELGGNKQPFYWLGGLLGQSGRGHGHGKTLPVVMVRSAQQRLVLHVDEVLGNQEVVVKNLGPQLNKVPGLAGISLLASGDVALIYNPVALASWYGVAALQRVQPALVDAAPESAPEEALAPLVLVVDDSLTVRRVTQRLLVREGYRVQLAKDGLDAMEQLSGDELPDVVLSDIEMPRMDGFDLVRNMRADARLAGLPVIMITSRIAQKHRDYAQQLGVNHYLGKPYDEDQLLALIESYTSALAADPPSA